MEKPRLNETSYIVLGMLEHLQPATPYDLKQVAALSTISFWSVPHSQLYSECARLAKEGLLSEEREQTGRRKRIYSLTEAGTQALEEWRAQPVSGLRELRDLGILKLFFGADPAQVARSRLPEHEDRLRRYEELRAATARVEVPRGGRLALESGIGHEREDVRFWKRVLEEEADAGRADESAASGSA